MNALLLMFHVDAGTGYAIERLLERFIGMAEILLDGKENIHVSFTRVKCKETSNALAGVNCVIEFDPLSTEKTQHQYIENYIRKHGIDTVFGFDLSVSLPSYRYLRKGGVRKIIAYQGAPMSDLNSGLKLLLKRLEVWFSSGSPDHYIFESLSMKKTACLGRGVPERKTSIVYMGVDTEEFRPLHEQMGYAHQCFNIPASRKVIYYSGHMEERKGVAVLVNAARYLYESYKRRDFHFLILGNQEGQEHQFLKLLESSGAQNHITFGGYRHDIAEILPSCSIGAIASTGWDSFTMSSLEIASCGLPLIVSHLQGLVESVEEGCTGFTFRPGDHEALASHISDLLDHDEVRERMGHSARARILERFTKESQLDNLVQVMKKVDNLF